MNREEHTYIEEYLKGNLDWELLVDYVGEDMARGVRIAEKYFGEEEENTFSVDKIEFKDESNWESK